MGNWGFVRGVWLPTTHPEQGKESEQIAKDDVPAGTDPATDIARRREFIA